MNLIRSLHPKLVANETAIISEFQNEYGLEFFDEEGELKLNFETFSELEKKFDLETVLQTILKAKGTYIPLPT